METDGRICPRKREAYNADTSGIFGKNGSSAASAEGLNHLAQDMPQSCEVIETHHLSRLSDYKPVMPGQTDALAGSCYLDNNKKQGSYPAAVTRTYGKGCITALSLDIHTILQIEC